MNKLNLRLPTCRLRPGMDLERSPFISYSSSSDGDTNPHASAQLQSRTISSSCTAVYAALSAFSIGQPGISEIHQTDPVLVTGGEQTQRALFLKHLGIINVKLPAMNDKQSGRHGRYQCIFSNTYHASIAITLFHFSCSLILMFNG